MPKAESNPLQLLQKESLAPSRLVPKPFESIRKTQFHSNSFECCSEGAPQGAKNKR